MMTDDVTLNSGTEETNSAEKVNEKLTSSAVETDLETTSSNNETSDETPESAPIVESTEESAADRVLRRLGQKSTTVASAPIPVVEEVVPTLEHTDEEEDVEDEDPHNVVVSENESEAFEKKYVAYSKDELLAELSVVLENHEVTDIRANVEVIKSLFYKKVKAEQTEQMAKMEHQEGEVLTYEPDATELQFKEMLAKYRQKRNELNNKNEKEKEKNLEIKLSIIEDLKNLTSGQDKINDAFANFHDLQRKWRETGQVPQSHMKSLYDNYHHQVEKFYDFVKINKELRDLDLRRNLEEKINICESAESLILEEKVVTAFKKLQELHHLWREVGPVPREHRDEIWERFKNATAHINKRHQDYFESLKQEQLNNLKAKTMICEEAEKIAQLSVESTKEWEAKSKELVELQKLWRAIGFAPRKDNNKIYQRFRKACDSFFDLKRDYFSKNKENQMQNLEMKQELLLQAETLKESSDWKKTTDELIDLQKRWKEIGPVPRKFSDEIWKKFRSACNYFFEQKEKHYKSIESEQDINLAKKLELLEKLENLNEAGSKEEKLSELKVIQAEWAKIGFVPLKQKDEIQKKYRLLINKHFDEIQPGNNDRGNSGGRMNQRIEEMKQNPKGRDKYRTEREKLVARVQKIESDLVTWENNIGFFAKSKNAEMMIKGFQQKIEDARQQALALREELKAMDESFRTEK